MDKLVSAIITTYGRKFDLILRSINSVKKQTYSNIEIVLVDDNFSNSEFRKDIEKRIVEYPEINYVKLEKNSGAQVARNTGMKNAKGEVLAFLDDDDEWLPEKIEKQVKALRPSVGLVYSKGFIVYEENLEQEDYITSKNFKVKLSFEDLLYADYIGTTTQALIPKNVLIAVGGFDVKQPARQDYELWVRISKNYDCVGVNEPLFKHYIHRGEQISKSSKKAIIGMENIYNKYKQDYKKYSVAKFHILEFLGMLHIKSKHYFVGFGYLISSFGSFIKAAVFNRKRLIMVLKEHGDK